jgi:molecular chaperone Hsp33
VITPEARPARDIADDTSLPFQIESLDVRGRVVRFGALIDGVLESHAYPEPVSILLAEAMALGALLGSGFKFDGRFTLQTQADGPVGMLVVDMDTPDGIRACARFDRVATAAAIAAGRSGPADLLGRGHLGMTVDQGAYMQRYQGIVALDGSGLEAVARTYFLQSEQIPTFVRIAVAPAVTASDGSFRSPWRAAAFLLQFLPSSPDRQRMADLPPGDAPSDFVAPVHREDESWVTARTLAETLTKEELIDPGLSPERLLYRLFHEHGVSVFDPVALKPMCRCSETRVRDMIRSFSPAERVDMIENGAIQVTCEFCNTAYRFDPADVARPDA